jgi:predicted nucleotidyltransferase
MASSQAQIAVPHDPGRRQIVLGHYCRLQRKFENQTSWYPADGAGAMRRELSIPRERLDGFCRRWKITELRVFGSALREDFRPESDLDLLVSFAPDADWSLMDHVAMEEELSGLAGRKVDLVSQRAIERSSNWIRRRAILESAEPYFAPR